MKSVNKSKPTIQLSHYKTIELSNYLAIYPEL